MKVIYVEDIVEDKKAITRFNKCKNQEKHGYYKIPPIPKKMEENPTKWANLWKPAFYECGCSSVKNQVSKRL